MSATAYDSILHLADSLTSEEKVRLIHDLTTRNGSSSTAKHERSILELSGLGVEIWNGVDAQEYVRNERAAWNG